MRTLLALAATALIAVSPLVTPTTAGNRKPAPACLTLPSASRSFLWTAPKGVASLSGAVTMKATLCRGTRSTITGSAVDLWTGARLPVTTGSYTDSAGAVWGYVEMRTVRTYRPCRGSTGATVAATGRDTVRVRLLGRVDDEGERWSGVAADIVNTSCPGATITTR